jgi:hypothetical protein
MPVHPQLLTHGDVPHWCFPSLAETRLLSMPNVMISSCGYRKLMFLHTPSRAQATLIEATNSRRKVEVQ